MPHHPAGPGPRLLFAAPLQGGAATLSQDEVLAPLFAGEGVGVRLTSPQRGRLHRLLDILAQTCRWRSCTDVAVISVFSGASFVVSDAASFEAGRLGLPTVLWLHGGNLPSFARRHQRWVDRVLGRAQALVAPSPYLATVLGRPDRPVEVIPNVIDLDAYPFKMCTSVGPRLLWMRSFHDVYNPHLALDALERLLRQHPDASLTMAGPDRGLGSEIHQRAAQAPLAGHVRFTGFLDAAGKQREFASHDIFLNTSRIDNMPVSVVEAAAFGLPVVTTEVGGIPYLLADEETALLVPTEDPQALADAVFRLLGDSELARRLSMNGRALAERSSWPRVREQWLDLLGRVERSTS